MVDNVAITPGTGATVAADDIGGVLYQRVKPTFGVDGSATDVSSTNPMPVVLGTGSNSVGTVVLGAGTAAYGKLAANSGVDIGDVDVTSLPGSLAGTADDAAVSGNPALIGGVAVETDNTDPTSVSAEGDIAYLRTDRNRRLLVNNRHPNGFHGADNQSSAQTNTSLVSAPGAGLSLYITDIIFSNGATAGTIKLVEDPAGTPADIGKVKYLAANGGCHLKLNTARRVTANKAIGYTSATVTTHTVEVLGYIAP